MYMYMYLYMYMYVDNVGLKQRDNVVWALHDYTHYT